MEFKLIVATLVAIILIQNIFSSPPPDVYFKGVRCNISASYIHKNYSCFVKSNRSVSMLNVYVHMIKPLTSIFVDGSLSYKYGNVYREIVKTPHVDWCKWMDQTQENFLTQQLILILRDTVPSIIHPCPYQDLIVVNCTVNLKSLAAMFPSGDYRADVTISDKNGAFIGGGSLTGALVLSLKDTFG